MAQFRVEDLLTIGELAVDRAALTARIGEMIYNSINIRADVESLSTKTGEFRVVLQGKVDRLSVTDKGEPPRDEWAADVETGEPLEEEPIEVEY